MRFPVRILIILISSLNGTLFRLHLLKKYQQTHKTHTNKMSKLNLEQRKFIKSLVSKQDRKEVKKALKQNNKEQEIFDSFKVLRKFFKSINPNK